MPALKDALVEIFRNGVKIREGYTDSEGKYKTKVEPGNYIIKISKESYQTIEKVETLLDPTEIIVNLPIALPPEFLGTMVLEDKETPFKEKVIAAEGDTLDETFSRTESVVITNE